MAAKDDLGRTGEQHACAYLVSLGYRVLERNWRDAHGEIDLIVRVGDTIAFVEVKTRRSARFGHPLEAVDARKRARLWRLANSWCAQHPDLAHGCGRRLDVVGILGADPQNARLEHLQGVSWV